MVDDHERKLNENRKIEVAKALLAVKGVASEDDYQKIHRILTKSDRDSAVDEAVQGLSKEQEFALMCRLMGTSTHMIHLEQRALIAGDFLVPDFLARFQPGCDILHQPMEKCRGVRALVEVKSTTKDKLKIGGSRLKRLRAFADCFALPLIFAVRFLRFEANALWIIVEDSDRAKGCLTIDYGDLVTGVRRVLWDEYFYMVPNHVYFRAVYDSAASEGAPYHEEYGCQREFQIVAEDGVPISGPSVVGNAARFTGVEGLTYSLFFEGFFPIQVAVQQEGTVTTQTLRPKLQFCSIADMVYTLNRLPTDSKGRTVFDPAKILAGGRDAGLITRKFVDHVADGLLRGRVLYKMGMGEEKEHIDRWYAYGGEKPSI